MQEVFNLLPNLSSPEMVEAFAVKTNDSMLALYLASLIRSVVALHGLINNRIENRDFERKTFGFHKNEAPAAKKEEKENEKDGKKADEKKK